MTLDVDAAEQALARLGDELGLSTIELAEGVCDVINAKMAQAIRTLTVEKGIEPRDYALVAFGGAGPMHAVFLAQELEIGEVIVPRFPGAFSAWGMLETEIRKDSRAYFTPLAVLDHDDLAATLRALEEEAYASLEEEGIGRDTGRVEHALDIRYVGQEYTLTIRSPARTSRSTRTSTRTSPTASTQRTTCASATPTREPSSSWSSSGRLRSAIPDASRRRGSRRSTSTTCRRRRAVVFGREPCRRRSRSATTCARHGARRPRSGRRGDGDDRRPARRHAPSRSVRLARHHRHREDV